LVIVVHIWSFGTVCAEDEILDNWRQVVAVINLTDCRRFYLQVASVRTLRQMQFDWALVEALSCAMLMQLWPTWSKLSARFFMKPVSQMNLFLYNSHRLTLMPSYGVWCCVNQKLAVSYCMARTSLFLLAACVKCSASISLTWGILRFLLPYGSEIWLGGEESTEYCVLCAKFRPSLHGWVWGPINWNFPCSFGIHTPHRSVSVGRFLQIVRVYGELHFQSPGEIWEDLF